MSLPRLLRSSPLLRTTFARPARLPTPLAISQRPTQPHPPAQLPRRCLSTSISLRQKRPDPYVIHFGQPEETGPNGPTPEGGKPSGGFLGDWRIRILGVVVAGGGVYYVSHLEQVPQTGRWRFMDLSPQSEAEYAAASFQEIMHEVAPKLLPPSHPLVRYCQTIADRIVRSAGLGVVVPGGTHGVKRGRGSGGWGLGGVDVGEGEAGFGNEMGEDSAWEIYVINDPKTPNAFVLPGKKIFVFTGILPVAADDAGLATVLGHEIAHQVVRHGAERMSQVKVLMFLGYLLTFVLGVDMGLTRMGLTFLLQLPNSRAQESEADRIGLRLMAQACFDPREASQVWVRMTEVEKQHGGGLLSKFDFVSTHPSSEKRIHNLEKWTPEALDIRAASACPDTTTSRFEAFKDDIANRLSEPFLGPSHSRARSPPAPAPIFEPFAIPSHSVELDPTGESVWQDPYAERPHTPRAPAGMPAGMPPPPRPRRGPVPLPGGQEERTRPVGEVDPVDEEWLKWIGGRRRT